jgi:nicotinamide-nucleotide amidase
MGISVDFGGGMVTEIEKIAMRVSHLLTKKKINLVTAESCTGGFVAQILTSIPGSSAWFERGFVTYSNAAKQEMLGVPASLIQQYGAVSEQVAQAMAAGALKHSQANVSLAITGIAGPDGGSVEKPVGLVWFGWQAEGLKQVTQHCHFMGDRTSIREQAVCYSLSQLASFLNSF